MSKTNLKALTGDGLKAFVSGMGLPAFRAKQLLRWIYERHAESIGDITEFSKELRERLSETAHISNLKAGKRLISGDRTEKFLFELEDNETIESVLIPDKDRLTLCISSQAGCAMGCRFCLTGSLGLRRNLRAHEIVDQVISVMRARNAEPEVGDAGRGQVTNIVLMGMGEPLANFNEVVDALWRMTGLMKISKRRITLSTAGIAPKISVLARKAPRVNLAISLNATTDEQRDRLMPVNKKYPLKDLLLACREFPLEPGRRITFEYVMLDGVNDSADDAIRLSRLLRGIRCKVNLIPFNAYEGADFKRPPDGKILSFQKILRDNNFTALIRKSKGQDIRAACGQLKAEYCL